MYIQIMGGGGGGLSQKIYYFVCKIVNCKAKCKCCTGMMQDLLIFLSFTSPAEILYVSK